MERKPYDIVEGACDGRIVTLTRQLVAEHAKTEDFHKFSLTMLDHGPKKQAFLHILRHVMSGPAGREVAHRFGTEPLVVADFCTLRCHLPGARVSTVNWHMDANLVGYNDDALVTWIPLHDIDGRRPGLRFLTWSGGADRRTVWDTMMARVGINRDDLVVTEQLPEVLGTTEFECDWPRPKAGDAVLFKVTDLHATDWQPQHTEERISLEVRWLKEVPRTAHEGLTIAYLRADGALVTSKLRREVSD
ncbi:MAG: hypothetical protein NXI19_01315 [Alphaproteobacteria bacterium]|nr:hypothetical protein [Alphaproteobacteria bacterium]